MTNDESVFREVDSAMAEERQWALFQQHGPAMIAGAVAIVAAVGGWQLWSAYQTSRAGDASLEFATAVDTLQETPDAGRAELLALSEGAPAGYATLAELRRAASLANSGERQEAIDVYKKVYSSGGGSQPLRQLARIRAASLALEDGRDAVLTHLGNLPEGDTIFSYYAREVQALAALQAKDFEAASEMFKQAISDPQTPEPLRQRAEEFAALAAAGKAGVNLTGEAQVDDLMRALDSAGGHSTGAESEGGKTGAGEAAAETADDAGDAQDVLDMLSGEKGDAPLESAGELEAAGDEPVNEDKAPDDSAPEQDQ